MDHVVVGAAGPGQLEQRRRRAPLDPQETVRVVLEHGQPALQHDVQQRLAGGDVERRPGRVVERRQDVQEPPARARAREHAQAVEIEAVEAARHVVDRRVELREERQHAIVGRRLDDRRAAAADDLAGHEAQPLQRSRGDQHPAGLDAVGRADPLPQRAVARRRAVVQRHPPDPLDGPPGALGEPLDREHVGRGNAPRERDDVARRDDAHCRSHNGRVRARGTIRPRPPSAVTWPSAKITSPRLRVRAGQPVTSQPS